MQDTVQVPRPTRQPWAYWAGHVLSGLGAAMMLLTGVLKVTHETSAAERFVNSLGYSEGVLVPLGLLEILSTALYYWPRTAMLGMVLLTGYLGGAFATELRVGGMLPLPLTTGVLLWAGLLLRQPRIADLMLRGGGR